MQIDMEDGFVTLSVPVKASLPAFEGRPLYALASSLHTYAGSEVEQLAAAQVILDRQSASFSIEGD